MEPSERIARMTEEGLLTEAQATLLSESLGPLSGEDKSRARRAILMPVTLMAAAALVVVIGTIWILTGSGEPVAIQDVSQTINQLGEHGEMNRSISAALGIALLLVVPLLLWSWLHNSLVSKEEQVFNGWAQVESNFQRRSDLIPALVEVVNRYLKHERETLTEVTSARSKAADEMATAIDNLIKAQRATSEILRRKAQGLIESDDDLKQLFQSQLGLKNSLSQINAVAESYPELKSSDQFLELQAQLEGTENRINVARMRFNDAVADYDGTMRMLPWSLVASVGSFKRKAYFRSDEVAKDAPKLNLD